MDKYSYFIAACKAECFLRKAWVLSTFAITEEPIDAWQQDPYPYRLVRQQGQLNYVDPATHQLMPIDGDFTDTPAYRFKEPCTVQPGDALNLKTKVESRYGTLLFNWVCLCWPFKDKIDYQNDVPVNVPAVEAIIEQRLTDDPDDLAQATDPNAIYVFEYERYLEAMFNGLTGYTQLCVPSATRKTMTRDPRTEAYRKQLLEENKDRLHDPAVIAKISKALVDFDKEWMKGDEGMGFMVSGKAFDVIRMRTQMMFGAEAGFGGAESMELITKSLSEGWDINKMPVMVNTLRVGSYNRGADTALGGAEVKTFYRLFQNAKITVEDCGTQLGIEKLVTRENLKRLTGYYYLNGNKTLPIDESCIGRRVLVRSPATCMAPGTDYCQRCMGDTNAKYPAGLPSAASDVGSQFMYMFMAAMHGKALKVAHYDYKLRIR